MSNVLCNGKSAFDETEVIPFRMEPETGGVVTISPAHAQIHNGASYSLDGEYLALASGATLYLLLDSSAITRYHWGGYQMETTGAPVKIYLYESPTVTSNGTPVVGINRNREIATPPGSLTYVGTTVSAEGTLLHHADVFSTGTGNNQVGRIGRDVDEWIFDTTKLYLLKITNEDNAALDVHFSFFWHEHE